MKHYTIRDLQLRAGALALALFTLPAFAQQPPASTAALVETRASSVKLASPKMGGCHGIDLELPAASLRDRACYQAERLISPGSLLHGLAQSSFAQWRNSPRMQAEDSADFGRRLQSFYARKAALGSTELLVGYLNREPLRPAASGQSGLWNRSRFALLSVVVTRNASGWRPALSPLAGSLASGFVTLGCCSMPSSMGDAIDRAALTYAGYFASALFHEFKPELKSYALRKLHR